VPVARRDHDRVAVDDVDGCDGRCRAAEHHPPAMLPSSAAATTTARERAKARGSRLAATLTIGRFDKAHD